MTTPNHKKNLMSAKVKQAILQTLSKIEKDTYDEDTIRTLLILSREHIHSENLIRELAHFIAHSERNQGTFHRLINSRYAKLKLVDDQIPEDGSHSIAKFNQDRR
jgi:hypothetical protein